MKESVEVSNIIDLYDHQPIPGWELAGDEVRATEPNGVVLISNVVRPTLTLHEHRPDAPWVIVVPGGGYHALAIDLEGHEVSRWLNELGLSAAVLKYRLPRDQDSPRWRIPVDDLKRAVALMRAKSPKTPLAVIGFSAGAHCSATAAHELAEEHQPLQALLLIYPAYLLTDAALSSEATPVSPCTAVFGVMTEDDHLDIEGLHAYAARAKEIGADTSLVTRPTGGHGYGLGEKLDPPFEWPKRASEFLRNCGF